VQQQLLLALVGDEQAGSRTEIVDRDEQRIEALVVVALVAVVATQDVASDAKQVAPKAGLAAKAIATLDAGEEGALDQIVDLVGRLVGEESTHAVEMPVEQLIAGPSIAVAPAVEQLDVRLGRRNLIHPRGC
jgi:hypothetical protein